MIEVGARVVIKKGTRIWVWHPTRVESVLRRDARRRRMRPDERRTLERMEGISRPAWDGMVRKAKEGDMRAKKTYVVTVAKVFPRSGSNKARHRKTAWVAWRAGPVWKWTKMRFVSRELTPLEKLAAVGGA